MNKKHKKWFIAQMMIDVFQRRAENSFIGKEPFSEKGYLIIYNKNAEINYYFRNPIQATDKYGWIVERKYLPSYLNKVVKEEK